MHWAYILLILATIWFLVYILGRLLKLDEKLGWTFGPLFLLMRTKRFNNFIMKIAQKYARFWRVFGNISIFFGLLLMFISIGVLLFSLINIFKPILPIEGPAVGFIIPGLTIPFKTALYLIIHIILTMIPHELAHGVVSHADNITLKSTGLVFFAIFFGAFVEPYDEEMKKASLKTRMRTFGAGMLPNLILGLITIPFFLFSSNIIAPFYYPPDGILIQEVVQGSPAELGGLERGMAIFDINNTHISTSEIFSNYMNVTKPNQIVILNTTSGIFTIRLATHPDDDTKGYLGVYSIPYQAPKYAFAWKFFPYVFEQQLVWMLIVPFGIVTFNALPIPYLLDGDKLLSSFLQQYIRNQKVALIILDVFRFIGITLFLSLLIISLVKFGFTFIG